MKLKAYIISLTVLLLPLINKAYGQESALKYTFRTGTTILAIVTPDTVWVAADTKTTLLGTTKYIQEKKIDKSKAAFFAIAGLSEINDSTTVYFNAKKAMKAILKKENDNIKRSCHLFVDSIKELFSNFPFYLQASILGEFKNISVLDYVIIKASKTGNDYIHQGISIKGEPGNLIVTTKEEIYDQKSKDILWLGHHDFILDYLNRNPMYFSDFKNVKDKLICLIKIQADNDRFVGMPVDIVILYKGKHKWYYKNKTCNSIE